MSPSSTTSCSTSAAPSASSRRSATPGRRRTSSPPSTTSEGTEGRFAARSPQTSFLQRLRPTSRTFRPLLPLTRTRSSRSTCAATTSSSPRRARGRTGSWSIPARSTSVTATTRSATPGPSARRRCAARGPLLRPPLRLLLNRWRQWDCIAAQRVDAYVANSHLTASRVRRYFGREATVLHPPVELDRFAPVPVERIGTHYLVLAELMAHKRIDVAVRAFNRAAAAARRGRRRAGAAPAAADGRAERPLHGPRQRRAGRRAAGQLRARSSSPRPRSSASRPSRRSPPGGP